ncbi:MAG: SoxR reducing system RseC family protein [Nitrosomonadales bacterium]|nr:SoxR reducing system RseC family protein [Nitrosomonadales bacterium]
MMMNTPADSATDYSAPALTEGIAHVVAINGGKVWLEPEQTGSCGGCAASGACGAKGIGTVANRLEARRFQIENPANLVVGERVVIGVRDNALIKASITAYAVPLATLLTSGAMAQWRFGSDLITMAAMVAGLGLGLVFSRMGAGQLLMRGDLAPQFIRRARPGETCNHD